MKMYKCARKVSQLWVPSDPTCYVKRPIIYKGIVQYVHQLKRKTYAWTKKVHCSHSNFGHFISVDTESTARYKFNNFPC